MGNMFFFKILTKSNIFYFFQRITLLMKIWWMAQLTISKRFLLITLRWWQVWMQPEQTSQMFWQTLCRTILWWKLWTRPSKKLFCEYLLCITHIYFDILREDFIKVKIVFMGRGGRRERSMEFQRTYICMWLFFWMQKNTQKGLNRVKHLITGPKFRWKGGSQGSSKSSSFKVFQKLPKCCFIFEYYPQ